VWRTLSRSSTKPTGTLGRSRQLSGFLRMSAPQIARVALPWFRLRSWYSKAIFFFRASSAVRTLDSPSVSVIKNISLSRLTTSLKRPMRKRREHCEYRRFTRGGLATNRNECKHGIIHEALAWKYSNKYKLFFGTTVSESCLSLACKVCPHSSSGSYPAQTDASRRSCFANRWFGSIESRQRAWLNF